MSGASNDAGSADDDTWRHMDRRPPMISPMLPSVGTSLGHADLPPLLSPTLPPLRVDAPARLPDRNAFFSAIVFQQFSLVPEAERFQVAFARERSPRRRQRIRKSFAKSDLDGRLTAADHNRYLEVASVGGLQALQSEPDRQAFQALQDRVGEEQRQYRAVQRERIQTRHATRYDAVADARCPSDRCAAPAGYRRCGSIAMRGGSALLQFDRTVLEVGLAPVISASAPASLVWDEPDDDVGHLPDLRRDPRCTTLCDVHGADVAMSSSAIVLLMSQRAMSPRRWRLPVAIRSGKVVFGKPVLDRDAMSNRQRAERACKRAMRRAAVATSESSVRVGDDADDVPSNATYNVWRLGDRTRVLIRCKLHAVTPGAGREPVPVRQQRRYALDEILAMDPALAAQHVPLVAKVDYLVGVGEYEDLSTWERLRIWASAFVRSRRDPDPTIVLARVDPCTTPPAVRTVERAPLSTIAPGDDVADALSCLASIIDDLRERPDGDYVLVGGPDPASVSVYAADAAGDDLSHDWNEVLASTSGSVFDWGYVGPAWKPVPGRIPFTFPLAARAGKSGSTCASFLARGSCNNRASCPHAHVVTKAIPEYCYAFAETGVCAVGASTCPYRHLSLADVTREIAALPGRKRARHRPHQKTRSSAAPAEEPGGGALVS